jgi:hypothetical protein
MRTLLILSSFTLAVIFCSCSKHKNIESKIKNEKTDLSVNPIFRGRYFHVNDKDSSTYFLFDIKLTNYTKSEIEFWTSSAAPEINVVVDNDYLNFFIPEINTNLPRLIRLKPNQEFLVPIVLLKSRHQRITSPIRFGFIINKPKYRFGLNKSPYTGQDPLTELFDMRKDKKNVIWSEPTDLFASNEFRYEIRSIINDSTFCILPRRKLIE